MSGPAFETLSTTDPSSPRPYGHTALFSPPLSASSSDPLLAQRLSDDRSRADRSSPSPEPRGFHFHDGGAPSPSIEEDDMQWASPASRMQGGHRFSGSSYSPSVGPSLSPSTATRGTHSFRHSERDYRAASMVLPDSYSVSVSDNNRNSILPYQMGPEPDDWMYDTSRDEKTSFGRGCIFTARGLANLGCLLLLALALLMLFAGYPVLVYFTDSKAAAGPPGGFNLGGVNGSGQVPETITALSLIDPATPQDALSKWGVNDDTEIYDLVWSDEFETDGRTFYPGDDPWWEAVDLHYWGTNNLEWYSPRRITTEGGNMKITLDKAPSHDLNYEGGMITTWNKMCLNGGYIEVRVMLPGSSRVYGLWPAVWTMGNLGRAGYGGSLDGMWPYSYDACDVGTIKNQTMGGIPTSSEGLSYAPGQRLSACTCPEFKDHPGPKRSDGTWVGRSAPEIDLFEAQISHETRIGEVSQSAQFAPYNANYHLNNVSSAMSIDNPAIAQENSYKGGVYQQAASVVVQTNQNAYEATGGDFSIYGFEYKTGEDGYISWVSSGVRSWTLRADAIRADPIAQIERRIIPEEPLYLIANLGISEGFGSIDREGLEPLWPVHMLIDYVRIYQPRASGASITCEPKSHPTQDYINRHIESYMNPNITTWEQAGQSMPPNSFLGEC